LPLTANFTPLKIHNFNPFPGVFLCPIQTSKKIQNVSMGLGMGLVFGLSFLRIQTHLIHKKHSKSSQKTLFRGA